MRPPPQRPVAGATTALSMLGEEPRGRGEEGGYEEVQVELKSLWGAVVW